MGRLYGGDVSPGGEASSGDDERVNANERVGWPTDPIAAVVHTDPYTYYDDLAARPSAWNESLGLWVAASPADVSDVLAHPAARVRPLDQPVPSPISNTPAGDVFGRLVRMHDRPARADIKAAIVAAIDGITQAMLDEAAAASASRLADVGTLDASFLDRWCAEFPIGVVAHLLGVERAGLDAAVAAARTIAACFGPVPPSDAGAQAPDAVGALGELVAAAVEAQRGLAAMLVDAVGPQRAADAVANTIGLFFQTFDSTAGLVANTLVRLERGRSVTEPSVHNTRRFFAEPADIGGAQIRAGDTVLVVLAAAVLPFGAGAHRCPASALVPEIVAGAVSELLDVWPDALSCAVPIGYRPLPNTRVPVFGAI